MFRSDATAYGWLRGVGLCPWRTILAHNPDLFTLAAALRAVSYCLPDPQGDAMTPDPTSRLELTSPPAAEPLSLSEAKQFLRIEHDADDDAIARAIGAARQAAEAYLRLLLMHQSYRYTAAPAGLTGDAVLMDRLDAVYDTAPQRSTLPYAVIAELAQEHLPLLGEQVWQVQAALEVWSDPQGRKSTLLALERLHGLLHYGTLSASGYTVREMRVYAASCGLAEGNSRMLGVVEITIIVAALAEG